MPIARFTLRTKDGNAKATTQPESALARCKSLGPLGLFLSPQQARLREGLG